MIYYNTDTQQDARYTNYPFTQTSDKLVNGVFVPSSMFIDIHICLNKAYVGIYIYKIRYINQIVYIHITDTTGQLQLYIPMVQGQQTAFVLNKYNTPCGLLQCAPQLCSQLSYITQASQNEQVTLNSKALSLLPECVSISITRGLQAIRVNGTSIDANSIDLRRNISYKKETGAAAPVTISMYPDDTQQSDTRLCYVNDMQAWNKHVIIKHNTLSDLRVLTKGNIQLIGVADVE